MEMGTKERLVAALRPRLDERASRWVMDTAAASAEGPVEGLLTAYTSASRQIGNGPLNAEPALSSPTVVLDRWTLEDAARAVLLLTRAERSLDPSDFETAARACYEHADAREQQSWLRGVTVLPDPERFLPLVIDACRTSVQPVFDAVACENPYPARFFPDRNFNQLILKALFNGVSLARVIGLDGRLNPDLSRMASDYAAERRAAGRSIPDDIALVTSDAGGSPT